MTTIHINLRLFGAFRTLGNDLSLALDEGATTANLGSALESIILETGGPERLIKLLPASRFSTDTDILGRDAPLKDGMQLAILPPVSGG